MIPALVSLGLLTGFAREILLAYLFGSSREVEIFRVAFGLPSVLSDGLAVSFVAILINLLLKDERNRPVQALRQAVWASIGVAFVVYALGMLSMPLQAQLLAPGITDDDQARLIIAGRICWTTFLFVLLSLPLRALMSINGRIWPGASSQVMRSGGFALALVIFAFAIGWTDVMAPSVAAALGGATVLAVHLLALGRRNRKLIALTLTAPLGVTILLPILTALSTVFITQLLLSAGRLMDRAAATLLGEGMVAGLEYSYSLILAVAAILGTSTNLVLAPRIGRSIRDNGTLSRSDRIIILGITGLSFLIGGGLTLTAHLIVPLVYEYGAFDAKASALTISIFRLHALSLGPLVLALLLTQVLLLQGRQSMLFRAALAKIAIKFVSLWAVLSMKLGIEGIAATLMVTEAGMAIVLAGILMARFRFRIQP